MSVLEHLDKKNLHHAYLVEGGEEGVLADILSFVEGVGVRTTANPDFFNLVYDTLKIDEARLIKSLAESRSYTDEKRIFIIKANSILLEAQNTMLKLFEEPISGTHFFVLVPSVDILIPTFVSRFYVIKGSARQDLAGEAASFIHMRLPERFEYIKNLLKDENDDEDSSLDSPRTKALDFLDQLESALHQLNNISRGTLDREVFEHLFKVRENLRQSGSAPKMLLESVALVVPVLV